MHISPSSQGNSPQNPNSTIWNRSWPWFIISGMAVAACVLGYLGFKKLEVAGDSPFDLAYKTLQLFVLESGYIKGIIPWQLEIARVLAPLVPAWAALQALRVIFREQREAFGLRRCKDHVVICGLGRKGLQLVSDFRSSGENVVVIESNENNPRLGTCQYLGVKVLIGSCTDKSLLSRARVERARYVLVITGDDGTNVETAILVYQLVSGRDGKIIGTVRCFVHVVSLNLCTLLERNDLLTTPDVKLITRIFNSFQNSARSLLETYPLEPTGFGEDDPRSVHLVVFGFGKMGESVALQAAKLGHFANGKPLRITVVDPNALLRQESFANRYPQLGNISDLKMDFIPATEENHDLISRLKKWVSDPDSIVSIVVCLDGDSASLACALNIITSLQPVTVPICVRMSQETGLATLLENRPGSCEWADNVHAFGMTSFNSTRAILLDRERDTLAGAFHRDYVRLRKEEGQSGDGPSMQPWDKLSADLQDSNRQMADHVPVKLRAIRCYKSGRSRSLPLEKFEESEGELLARMEHSRWCAERFISGWRLGATNHGEKTNANLVGWDRLEKKIQDYDRQAVDCIPRVLELNREYIFRITESETE